MLPKVTVGVPVYNGERYLRATLRALQEQSLSEIEVIISDNGSTDATREIGEEFAAADSRFTFLRSEVNRGLSGNYNVVLERATAPLFMWNASDDFIRPDHLLACRTALMAHPEASIAFSRVDHVDSDGASIGSLDDEGLDFLSLRPSARVELFLRRQVYQAIGYGGLFRTAELREVGGLPGYFGSDIVLGVRMAMRSPWVQVPRALFVSRMHDQQASKTQGGDIAEQLRRYDPTSTRQYGFPQWNLDAQLIRAALRSPAPPIERVRAVGSIVSRWVAPNWRLLPFDIKRNLIHLVRGRYVGAYH